jgi:hypothetical protein
MGKAGVLLATITTTVLISGCQSFEVACPAIGQAAGVAVTVAADYAPAVRALHLKACQDGTCKAADLELVPGTKSVDQGCSPAAEPPGGYGPGSVCSATAAPDGTKRGMLQLGTLSEAPMDVTVTGTLKDGRPLPLRTLHFTPQGNYPFGEQCGRFLSASVVLNAAGLRQDGTAR